MDWLTLAQALDPTAPPDIPAWLWLVLATAAGFFAKDFWPWLKSRWEREDARHAQDDASQDERFLKAYEQTAKALESLAVTIDVFSRSQVVTAFQIDEMRREIRALAGRSTPANSDVTLATMLRTEVKP